MIFNELNEYASKINNGLLLFFKNKSRKNGKISNIEIKINDILKDFVLRGGKRIRAFLMYCGYKCVGGKNDNEIINASLCLELLQAYLLIHDDIVDKSEIRRGGPTVHKIFEKEYSNILNNIKSKELGNFLAIWIGDLCCFYFYKILLNSNFPNKNTQMAVSKFNDILESAVYGQIMDILAGAKVINLTEKDIYAIQDLKTSRYTFKAPLQIGAILGGGNLKDINVFERIAQPLGQAFQIKDDINGLFGDPKKTGKPIDSDLKMGKMTLLILKALEKSNRRQKKFIFNCLGNPKIRFKDVEIIRDIIINSGSLLYSQKKVKKLINKAKNIITKTKFNSKGKILLLKLTDFIEYF